MFRIALVNVPFAALESPSLGLSQLKAAVELRMQGNVAVRVVYANHDYGTALGCDLYDAIAHGPHYGAGLGDWLFRVQAWPELPDNAAEYLDRYYPLNSPNRRRTQEQILATRKAIEPLLDQVIDRYALDRADLVGLTSLFSQNVACFALARRLKQRNPRIHVVMGGANCEAPMGAVIAQYVPQIDAVFSGPGLCSFPEYVARLVGGASLVEPQIRGVFSRAGRTASMGFGGDVPLLPRASEERWRGDDLDLDIELPIDFGPFLDAFDERFPDGTIKPMLMFETARGCWWGERSHCSFCGLNGLALAYHAMSPELAVQRINTLMRTYTPRCQRFICVDNILPTTYIKDVLPRLETPPGVTLHYEVKANLREADVRVLAEAGALSLQPGIEALSTRTLRLMRKGTTAFINLQLLKHCVTYGIEVTWSLLAGLPGQDDDVYARYAHDLPLLVHLPPPTGLAPVRFDRYSPYHFDATAYGLDLRPRDFYALTYPFSEEAHADLAYFFSDASSNPTHQQILDRWTGQLVPLVSAWVAAWTDESRERPCLRYVEGTDGCRVFDSRCGDSRVYHLTPRSAELLRLLETPHKLTELPALTGLAVEDLVLALDELRDRGLIFEEDGRALSLVTRGASATSTPAESASIPVHAATAGEAQPAG